ncbi:MAG: Lrp/AsnC family transcriptional regulator [Anderseniella sp.]|jgi:DNA-binding Lrp family transcriptional regulator|nr:Lrp/AsnC family transcriptional regulator [Anderseniella sp.]
MNIEGVDGSDRKILRELQADSSISVADLAARINLSPSACHRRIKLLEQRGLIAGYGARLDRKKLGLAIEFFVEISLVAQSEQTLEAFEQAVRRVPEILECHLMGGQYDYLLRISAASATDYERIHRQAITRLPGVARVQSCLALRTVKPWTGLPV